MGKIAAIGGGRYSDGEITSFAGIIRSLSDAKKPKMLFLPTAGRDNIDGDEFMLDAFKDSGCETDILFLTDETLSEEQIQSAILGADIIYAGGGDLVHAQKRAQLQKRLFKDFRQDVHQRERARQHEADARDDLDAV